MAAPTTAQSPFDDTTANIVLRSCDNVNFYVYKDILKMASPFFQTLFSLPQPTPVPSSDRTRTTEDEYSLEGLPIIPVPEESKVLDHILRICYPRRNPERLSSLVFADKMLTAAFKYEIEPVIDIVREDIVRVGTSSPVQMYMLLCRQGLENEARIAADLLRQRYDFTGDNKPLPCDTDFVRIALEIYTDDCAQLPAIYLYRLLRHICFETVKRFCDTSPWAKSTGERAGSHQGLSLDLEYVMVDCPADIALQSSDGVVIPTHKLILRAAMATSILSQAQTDDCPQQDGIPVVTLQYPTGVVTQLVRACYPGLGHTIHSSQSDDDLDLFYVAKHYNMSGIASTAKARWLLNTATDPLTVYMVARSNGWTEEAERAARDVVLNRSSISNYWVPKMGIAGTASHYYALLKHFDALNQRLRAVASQKCLDFNQATNETWNDPSYACTASISPIVAFRAVQSVQSV